MSDPSFHTTNLQGWLGRLRELDPAARDDLLRACQGRLEGLARRMLRRYPSVARWADTGDVFTGAALRFLRALESVDVTDTRQFFNLAAAVIRRELIDMARHFHGPHGAGANHASHGPGDGPEPAAPEPGDELDRWAALHEAAEELPVAEREVFGLTFYHGWTQQQIAELFGVSDREVRRRWRAACEILKERLGGILPGED